MKITVTENKSYKEIMALPHREHKKPNKSNLFWRTLLKLVSLPALLNTNFKCEKIGMEKLPKNQPALVLMNHSGFIDLEIIVSVLFPRPFNIITTSDAFIGMDWLMRQIGCAFTSLENGRTPSFFKRTAHSSAALLTTSLCSTQRQIVFSFSSDAPW